MSTWILVPGHGGMSPGGIYLTQGKQSPQVPPGIYEGAFNREICNRIERMCIIANIPCVVAIPGPMNPTLKQRVEFCNDLHAQLKNCIVLTIHANASASDGKWHSARGFVPFIAPNCSQKSKDLAQALHRRIPKMTGLDSRGIKERRFAMVAKTKCPAVLLECGFMDNLTEATYLASQRGQDQIAAAIFFVMQELDEVS